MYDWPTAVMSPVSVMSCFALEPILLNRLCKCAACSPLTVFELEALFHPPDAPTLNPRNDQKPFTPACPLANADSE